MISLCLLCSPSKKDKCQRSPLIIRLWTVTPCSQFAATTGAYWSCPKTQKVSSKHTYCLLLYSISQSSPLLFFNLYVFLGKIGPFYYMWSISCITLQAPKTLEARRKNGLKEANLSGFPCQNHKNDMKIRDINVWIGGLAPKKYGSWILQYGSRIIFHVQ